MNQEVTNCRDCIFYLQWIPLHQCALQGIQVSIDAPELEVFFPTCPLKVYGQIIVTYKGK